MTTGEEKGKLKPNHSCPYDDLLWSGKVIRKLLDRNMFLCYFSRPVKAIIHPPQPGQTHHRHDNTKWIQIDVRHVFSKLLANALPSSSRKIGLVFDVTDLSQSPISEVAVVSGSDVSVNQVRAF